MMRGTSTIGGFSALRWTEMLLIAVLGSGAGPAEASTVGPVTNPGNGHQYYFTDDLLTWESAEAWAVGLGGHLAAIDGASENAWITGHLPASTDDLWIGARDDANTTDDVFEWVSGEPWGFTNWKAGEPDDEAAVGGHGDNVILNRLTGEWSDKNPAIPSAGGIAEVLPVTGVAAGTTQPPALRLVVQTLSADGRSAIQFEVPSPSPASLFVFDVAGRPIRALATGWFDAGRHEVSWDLADARGVRVASGLYFVSLQARGERRTARVIVAR